MSSTELFRKHFGEKLAVDLRHPNMENFFNELNEECKQEDVHKNCNLIPAQLKFLTTKKPDSSGGS